MACSPSQGSCCGSDCNFKDNSTVCKNLIDSDCDHEITCSGKTPYCAFNDTNLINCNQGLCIKEVIFKFRNYFKI